MFEFISKTKVKKDQKEIETVTTEQTFSQSAPVLDAASEDFLEKVISGKGESSKAIDISQDLDLADIDKVVDELPESSNAGEERKATHAAHEKKASWFTIKAFSKNKKKHEVGPQADPETVTSNGETRKEDELSQVLEDLNLSADNNRAYFLSPKSRTIVQKFTLILKDLINGVPTAYNDLVSLLEDSDDSLNKMYEKLPNSIKVLITKLPDKMKGHLAPELLAVAAQAPGLMKGSGISIKDLISMPGAIPSMLGAIMNFLKLRWPAFMGTNILLSMGLFVLLFVFWYCHKRGKEERLKKETKLNDEGRVEEIDDDQVIEKP